MKHSKIEYEKIVLNSIIEYPDTNFKYANETIFASEDNKHIYNSIQDLIANKEPIIIDKINEKLPTGSQVALLEACSSVALENIENYVAVLKELSIKREIEKILDSSSKEMEVRNAYELLDKINSSIKGINKSCGFETDYDYFGMQRLCEVEEKEPIFLMQESLPIAENTVTILAGSGGCVDKDTEYLGRNGWKKISEYDGEEICFWNKDGSTYFKKPIRYIKEKEDELISIKSKTVDMVLSKEHRVPYMTRQGKVLVKELQDILEHKRLKIPRYFNTPSNAKGLDLSKELIRVLIMQSADGHVLPQKTFKIRINVKKEKKRERVIKLLEDAKIPYVKMKSKVGWLSLTYYPPKEIAHKGLDILWGANQSQLLDIYDEVIFWDGYVNKRKNILTKSFTGNKSDVDFVQYVMSSVSGKYSSLSKDNREYKKEPIYDVSQSHRYCSTVELSGAKKHKKAEVKTIKSKDGYKYCFETDTTFWLARRNGKIFPTGNSGKSLITLQMAIRYVTSTGRDAFCWLSEDSLAMSQKRARLICNMLGVDSEQVMKKVWISAKTPFSIVNKGRDGMKVNHEWIKFKQATKQFGFIVLDPLISFMSSLDENSNTDAKALMKEIVDYSREDEKTVVIIHHSAKGTASARGAGAIKDAVRLVYNVKPADGLMRDVTIEKDNNNIKSIIGADGLQYQIL